MQVYDSDVKGPLEVSGWLDPDDVTPIEVFWGAPVWVAETIYHIGDIVRPLIDNGYYYECVVTGKTGLTEPTWAKKVTDGAVFKAKSYDLFILPGEAITASTWAATGGATLAAGTFDAERAGTVITAIPDTVTSITLTNQVTKASGAKLTKSFLYNVDDN